MLNTTEIEMSDKELEFATDMISSLVEILDQRGITSKYYIEFLGRHCDDIAREILQAELEDAE
jgi:hypothetical protein